MRSTVYRTLASGLLAALPLCSLAASPIPATLDEYGVLGTDGKVLSLRGNTMVYDLAAPLFTDHALKFRTLTLPSGSTVHYRGDEVLDLPIGTIISKTFYYARDPARPGGWLKTAKSDGGEQIDLARHRMIETRILRRDSDGSWQANTYVWNEAQTQATLRRIGQDIDATLHDAASKTTNNLRYSVPNARQCQTCHAVNATNGQAGIQPIGPRVRYINLDYRYDQGPMNQLAKLATLGKIDGLPTNAADLPKPIAYADPKAGTVEQRARAYLEINCAHCHNAMGDARQSGLMLTPDAKGSALGICKQHVAAGSGGANLTYDIVPGKPNQSLLISRMEATTGQAMMPRVGRSLADQAAIELLRAWIAAMPGGCDNGH
ncbi:SO2930 family diheme c-type cytochrome [Chitinimonas sp. BJYL2]|uniref:SO2930 family diheme c-type cytochrome n=1 Tax=Chitinimonas sp. BJYL2 TaxID=2976696 RepID=UPI0022B335EC|nr:SO2930 family diheme c-type cytochrome [Chitinimonas sp. BJYL2]